MDESLPAISRDEGLREVDQIRDALGIDEDQNIAYAELIVDGEQDELISVSGRDSPIGSVALPAKRRFETFFISFDRSADAEVKLLEEIASRLTQASFSVVEVRLFTERRPCDSCKGVIAQFRGEFAPPEVRLSVGRGDR